MVLSPHLGILLLSLASIWSYLVLPDAYTLLNVAVEHNEFLGEFTRYHVRVGESIITADQAYFSGMVPFSESSAVRLRIDTSQIRYLPA